MKGQPSAIHYTPHRDGIHEILFLEATARAIDEWLVIAESLMQPNPPDDNDIVRMLLDNTQTAMPPINYAYRQLNQVMRKYPNRRRGRVAFLVNAGFLTSLVDSFLSILPANKEEVRFFSVNKRDEAIAWLLKE